jgi:hypothetical protein
LVDAADFRRRIVERITGGELLCLRAPRFGAADDEFSHQRAVKHHLLEARCRHSREPARDPHHLTGQATAITEGAMYPESAPNSARSSVIVFAGAPHVRHVCRFSDVKT